jgi:hypothetical protein
MLACNVRVRTQSDNLPNTQESRSESHRPALGGVQQERGDDIGAGEGGS